jgi:hypothetical protein
VLLIAPFTEISPGLIDELLIPANQIAMEHPAKSADAIFAGVR